MQIASAIPAEVAERLHDTAEHSIERFLSDAREEIIQTVLDHAQYPAPSRIEYRQCRFCLDEFLFDGKQTFNTLELQTFLLVAIKDKSQHGAFERLHAKYEAKVEKLLAEHFTDDHPEVIALASRMLDDDLEAA